MRLLSFILLFWVLSPSLSAQTLQQKLKTSPLDSQFVYLNLQSRNQDKDFKIIRKTNLDIIRQNVKDSLSTYKKQISELKGDASSSAGSITGLQDSVKNLSSALEQEQQKTDSISFLGIQFSKSSYHMMVWIIIVVLAVALFAILAAFRKAKVDTDESKHTVDELQEELQSLRKKSMEREQQLKRQLLDEQLKRNS
jgi:prefoldin subunit 5